MLVVLTITRRFAGSAAQDIGAPSMCMKACMPRPSGHAAHSTHVQSGTGQHDAAGHRPSSAGAGASGHTKSLLPRTQPEDPQKAAQFLATLKNSVARFSDPAVAQAAGYDLKRAVAEHGSAPGTLYHAVNSKVRPGDPVDPNNPRMLMYRKNGDGSFTMIGAVFVAVQSPPDLGLGQWHSHDGATKSMKHVWFTDDVQTAFSDTRPKQFSR